MYDRNLSTAKGISNFNLGDLRPCFVSLHPKVTSHLCRSLSIRLKVPPEYHLIASTSIKHMHTHLVPPRPFYWTIGSEITLLDTSFSAWSFEIFCCTLESTKSFIVFLIKIGWAERLLLQSSIRILIFYRCSIVSQRLKGALFLRTPTVPFCFFIHLAPCTTSPTFIKHILRERWIQVITLLLKEEQFHLGK